MPESDVEVNNAWSCTSVRSIGLNDVPRHESILYRGTKAEGRDNVIGMVTRLQAGLSEVRVPAGTKDLRLLQNVQTCSGVHPASYSMGTGGSSGGKATQPLASKCCRNCVSGGIAAPYLQSHICRLGVLGMILPCKQFRALRPLCPGPTLFMGRAITLLPESLSAPPCY